MVPPKTVAERHRKWIEELKAKGKCDEYKKVRALKRKIN